MAPHRFPGQFLRFPAESPTLTRGRRQWRNGGERAPERHERDGPTPPIEAMRCRSEATKTKRCAVGKMLAMRCRSARRLLGKLDIDLIENRLAIEGTQFRQMLGHHLAKFDREHGSCNGSGLPT